MCSKMLHRRNETERQHWSSSRPTDRRSLTQEIMNSQARYEQDCQKPNESRSKSALSNFFFYGFLIYVCFDTYTTHAKLDTLQENYTFLGKEKDQIQSVLNSTLLGNNLTYASDRVSDMKHYHDVGNDLDALLKKYDVVSKRSNDLSVDLEKKIVQHENLKELVIEELDFLYEKNDEYQQHTIDLKSELEHAKDKHSSLLLQQDGYEALKDEINFLYKDRDLFLERSEKITLELEEKSLELEGLNEKKVASHEEMSSLYSEIDRYQKQIADLTGELEYIKGEYDDEEIEFLYSELESAERKNAQLKKGLLQAKVEIEGLRKEFE